MRMTYLGRTGVQVSELCFGTMSFGGDADPAEASRLYAACRERGINFFDCADAYSRGRAEEILGDLMAGHRDELVVTSKFWNPMGADPNMRGANRRHMARAVEASLKRLNTDRLDVYFIHHWDETVDLEDVLRGLEDLVASGKVLYLGASNFAAWQIMKALGISDRRGWARFDVIQPMYSLVKRQAEVELLPMAAAERLAVISYSPMGGGVLSGKYRLDRTANVGRLAADAKYGSRYGEDWVHETAAAFCDKAAALGVHPATLAVAWAKSRPEITAPIIGARSAAQLAPSLAAADFEMSPELRDEIAALSRKPATATDRREEQEGFPATK